MSNKAKLGFIGLGQMGAPMAERLLAPDIELYVHDPRPEAMAPFAARGAIACGTVAELAQQAEIIFACLPSGAASRAVAEQAAKGGALRLYADLSTIGAEAAAGIAAVMAAAGKDFVDAPISGGPAGARAGTLAMMAAGAPEAVAALRPWQLRIGREVFVLGEKPGQAQVMKLVNNLLFAANLATACEAFAMGAKAGLDADAMLAMVNAGTGRSMVTEQVMQQVLSGRFAFGAALSILDKDMTHGLEEAAALGVPMWVLEQAARLWRFAATQGDPKADITTLAKLLEGWGGAPIRSARA